MKRNELNRKLSDEIKKILYADFSLFYCRGEIIKDVSDMSIRLDKDYGEELSETIAFNGDADFWFALPYDNDHKMSHRCLFRGEAIVNNFEIKDINKPILITKQ